MEKLCEKCNKSFSTKYTLKKHMEANICKNDDDNKCSSSQCEYKSSKKSDVHKPHR